MFSNEQKNKNRKQPTFINSLRVKKRYKQKSTDELIFPWGTMTPKYRVRYQVLTISNSLNFEICHLCGMDSVFPLRHGDIANLGEKWSTLFLCCHIGESQNPALRSKIKLTGEEEISKVWHEWLFWELRRKLKYSNTKTYWKRTDV